MAVLFLLYFCFFNDSIQSMHNENVYSPDKKKIEAVYEKYNTVLSDILGRIESSLRENINLRSRPTFKSRIKSFPSYYRKLLRVKTSMELSQAASLLCLTDIIGIRVICAFLEDLSVVEQQI